MTATLGARCQRWAVLLFSIGLFSLTSIVWAADGKRLKEPSPLRASPAQAGSPACVAATQALAAAKRQLAKAKALLRKAKTATAKRRARKRVNRARTAVSAAGGRRTAACAPQGGGPGGPGTVLPGPQPGPNPGPIPNPNPNPNPNPQPNQPPAANSQSASTDEDGSGQVTLAGSDPNGDPIGFKVTSLPAHGKLFSGNSTNPADQITGVPQPLTGAQVTYQPDPDYAGPDAFDFVANDGAFDSPPATVSLSVNPVNDPPTADPLSIGAFEDGVHLLNLPGSDLDNDPLSFRISSLPSHGKLYPGNSTNPADEITAVPHTLPGSEVTYRPSQNYSGPDGFNFLSNDGTVDSAEAVVTLTVQSTNDAPFWVSAPTVTTTTHLQRDGNGILIGATTTITVGTAPTDPDGDALTYSWSATNGSISGNSLTGVWTRVISLGSVAPGTATITATDPHGAFATRSFNR